MKGKDSKLRTQNSELQKLRAELKEKDSELRTLNSELQKSREKERDLEDTRTAMLYMLEDINESTANLERAKNEWQATFESIADPVYLHDKEFKIVRANKAFAEAAGVPFDEIIGRPYYEIFPELETPFNVCMKSEEIKEEEIPLPHENRVFNVKCFPIKGKDGKHVYSIHIMEDITGRKKSEAEIIKLSRAIEQSPSTVTITDTAGNIEYVNPKFTQLTGYTFEEVTGKNPRFLKSGEQSEEFYKELWDTISSGKEWRGEFHNKKKNGEMYWELATVSPIRNREGVITHFIKAAEDVTRLKQSEEEREKIHVQLIHAQKMEAIGVLAGGVAHDFNNLLTTSQGYAEMAMLKFDKTDPLYKDLEHIDKAAMRPADLTSQLLLFSRKKPMELTFININNAIESLLKMLHRLIGEDIAINTDLESDIRTIKADRGSIEQVIMNIAINARDAMSECSGGRLVIKTENMTFEKEQIKTIPYALTGRFVCLTISDTGTGMDKETVDRIFEPFFSTKVVGKGTGLGLSVVYGIIKKHEGWINVYSKPGEGSIFKVYLPAFSVKAEDETEETISLEELRGSGERILLVEDEEAVREFAVRALEENGYNVFSAASVKDAINVFEREGGDFHLVFSDVVLPDQTGLQLVDELFSRKPELHVLMSSGYTDEKSHWSIIQERGFRFLQKPYALPDLLRAVKEAIGIEG